MSTTQYQVRCLCKSCAGRGYVWQRSVRVECATCRGTGEVNRTVNEVHSDSSKQ